MFNSCMKLPESRGVSFEDDPMKRISGYLRYLEGAELMARKTTSNDDQKIGPQATLTHFLIWKTNGKS